MLFSTVFTFFVVPATYLSVERARQRLAGRRGTQPEPLPVAGGS